MSKFKGRAAVKRGMSIKPDPKAPGPKKCAACSGSGVYDKHWIAEVRKLQWNRTGKRRQIMTDHPQEHTFDYCAVSPDKKHSEEWYCNGDCANCKAGAQDGPLLWVGSEAPTQEHESLDQFIEKVEASGEDKKHEPFGWVDARDVQEDRIVNFHYLYVKPRGLKDVPIYTQAQRDAYAAEAVKQERERCAEICRKVSAEDATAVERETNSILRSRFEYGAIVAHECADRIQLANQPKDQP